jgi:hypothetical protein
VPIAAVSQSFLLMRLSVVRPIETRKFIAVSRQYLHNEEEAIDMWKSVVNSINLSDKQKLDIVQWKQLFMQKVEPIVVERKKLNVQIQAHLPQVRFCFLLLIASAMLPPKVWRCLCAALLAEGVETGQFLCLRPAHVMSCACSSGNLYWMSFADGQGACHLPCCTQESFHTRNAITYIKTHEAVAKLRENLRAEHNVTIEFCAAVFKAVGACYHPGGACRLSQQPGCSWRCRLMLVLAELPALLPGCPYCAGFCSCHFLLTCNSSRPGICACCNTDLMSSVFCHKDVLLKAVSGISLLTLLQVLNSFQMASLLVQAYPAVPDALAVASAVIADMNDKGQALPSALANMQSNQGLLGLSMAAPLLCPASDHNPNAPSTAAAAAAAAAAAGVSQGASIGLGVVGQSQPLPLLQTLHGVGHRCALNLTPAALAM